MTGDITKLPDYLALKKLAESLWQRDGAYHGAAVMVGAGFSRVAGVRGDDRKKMPLWRDLAEKFASELGYTYSDYDFNREPLKLAQEYCEYFGRRALHDLIEREINDSDCKYGQLHLALLKFPWSEVLTTNWDTLLERAAAAVHSPVYNIVLNQEKLASAGSPRIVKLHGTLDARSDLVVTNEDYQEYPECRAAFVNLARQVLIENELCLLGFSGDDPNFKEWTHWIRDQFNNNSRRIYMVGALNLSDEKREELRKLNITPIDLFDLVRDYDDEDARHLAATEIFMDALVTLKPPEEWLWEPDYLEIIDIIHRIEPDAACAEEEIEKLSLMLKKSRKSYPDWLVCPLALMGLLRNQIDKVITVVRKVLPVLTNRCKQEILYEIF